MTGLVYSLAVGGGLGALAMVAAAYYYGVRAGRALETDENAAKVAGRSKKANKVLMDDRTAEDVEDRANSGTF